MDDNIKKIWKTFGVFETYEEAVLKKLEISGKFDAVKIRRSGPGGDQFKIKTWVEPGKKPPTKNKKKKSKKS